MNVQVLGVLVRRQHAHADHEAFLVKAELQRDALDALKQLSPKLHVADPKVQQRWDPLLGDDDDVDLPPLGKRRVHPVAECEYVFVLVNHVVLYRSRAVEAPAERVVGIGLLPLRLRTGGDDLREEFHGAASIKNVAAVFAGA